LIPRSRLFTTPPAWFPASGGPAQHVSPPTASWLFETGSLTQRLRGFCGAGFGVRLLRQDRAKPFADEALALGLPGFRLAVVREVLLQCGDRPWVAARSVIPDDALHGDERRLARLGDRPLGEILFADPRLERARLELAEVETSRWQPELLEPLDIRGRVWGRRSLYTLGTGKLLVAEFFLPALFSGDISR
jgi:chorismate--pyruvate lyase